jgi:hypothetical protein
MIEIKTAAKVEIAERYNRKHVIKYKSTYRELPI